MTSEECWLSVERIAHGRITADEIAEALEHTESLLARAKQLRDAVEAAILRRTQRSGPFLIGDMLYYAGFQTKTTTTNKRAVLDSLLVHTQGDLAATASLLVAQPYKSASVRSVLPPQVFTSLFRVTRGRHLGTRLLKADTRFIRHPELVAVQFETEE